MSKTDAVLAVGRLMAAFRPDRVNEETVQVYADRLEDIDRELLAAAVNRIIDSSKFFPAVSEIRDAAGRIAGVLPAMPAEALAIIRLADVRKMVTRRDGSFAYEERVWEWPEMSPATNEAVKAAIQKAGEPCDENGKDHFGWEMGFQKLYEAEASVVSARVLSDLSMASLPAAAPLKSLPEPHEPDPLPGPDDMALPVCVRCHSFVGVYPSPEGAICFACQDPTKWKTEETQEAEDIPPPAELS